MGILVKFTAECDKCHARKPIEEVYAYNIKLPKGWISTYENGVLCEACKEKQQSTEPKFNFVEVKKHE